MDADDVCVPHRLQRQVDFIATNPDHVLVGSDVVYMDREGFPIFTINAGGHTDTELRENFYRRSPMFHPTVTVYKEAIMRAGGYPAGALLFEDWLLWKKVMEFGKATVLPEVLLHVRLNPESVTVDEKWRGPEFAGIRRQALGRGAVTPEEGERLHEIIRSQDFKKFKEASYHVLIGKKFLWDNPNPQRARKAFSQALKHYPRQLSTWALLGASLLPAGWMQKLYRRFKKA
jgi:hypothetical protein